MWGAQRQYLEQIMLAVSDCLVAVTVQLPLTAELVALIQHVIFGSAVDRCHQQLTVAFMQIDVLDVAGHVIYPLCCELRLNSHHRNHTDSRDRRR